MRGTCMGCTVSRAFAYNFCNKDPSFFHTLFMQFHMPLWLRNEDKSLFIFICFFEFQPDPASKNVPSDSVKPNI